MDNVLQQAVENYKKNYVINYKDSDISVGDIISSDQHKPIFLNLITTNIVIFDSDISVLNFETMILVSRFFNENHFLVDCIGKVEEWSDFRIMILKNKNQYYCHVISKNLISEHADFSNYWKVIYNDMALEYDLFF